LISDQPTVIALLLLLGVMAAQPADAAKVHGDDQGDAERGVSDHMAVLETVVPQLIVAGLLGRDLPLISALELVVQPMPGRIGTPSRAAHDRLNCSQRDIGRGFLLA
jgi:hypothetical protein